jgi:hypothetical protein
VTHAEQYKASGLTPGELYAQALAAEPNASKLLAGATPAGEIRSTKDWSFLAGRMAGENWMLVGESAGFADPILAGGISLAMVGAREAAHILAAILRGEHEEGWLKGWYDESQARRISQHIKFADYWYSANGHFSDLKEYTSQIAAEAGLQLKPEEAFRWLGTGGFVSDNLARPEVGSYRLGAVKSAMQVLTGLPAEWEMNKFNDFTLNLEGCDVIYVPYCEHGRIQRVKCYRRGTSLLPMVGTYRNVFRALARERDAAALVRLLRESIAASPGVTDPYNVLLVAIEAIEGMVAEGWVTAAVKEGRPVMNVHLDEASFSMVGQ